MNSRLNGSYKKSYALGFPPGFLKRMQQLREQAEKAQQQHPTGYIHVCSSLFLRVLDRADLPQQKGGK